MPCYSQIRRIYNGYFGPHHIYSFQANILIELLFNLATCGHLTRVYMILYTFDLATEELVWFVLRLL